MPYRLLKVSFKETASHSLIEFLARELLPKSHMNPILASGIVSLGKEVYDRLNTPSPSKLSIDDISFGKELEVASTTASSKTLEQLEKKFRNQLDVSKFLSKEAGNQVHLEKRADGSMQLISSSGRRLILPLSENSCSIGNELFIKSLDQGVNLSIYRANAITIKS